MNQTNNPLGGGIAEINDKDLYGKYINHVLCAFSLFNSCYLNIRGDKGEFENKSIRYFLKKLLYTFEVLRMKYCYDKQKNISVDLTASGFPAQYEYECLKADLASRDARIKEVREKEILKETLVEHLIKNQEHPIELLWEIGKRSFLEMLDFSKMFLIFTPGKIKYRSTNEETRGYVISWGSFDFKKNRPYFHVMSFNQDITEQPLDEFGENYDNLVQTLKYESNNAPEIAILAATIDNALEWLHPKIIKRIEIGPLYSPFLAQLNPMQAAPSHGKINELMLDSSRKDDDFILFFREEMAISLEQQKKSGIFNLSNKVREIFYIPDRIEDEEGFVRKASSSHRTILLPHTILQQLIDQKGAGIRKWNEIKKIAINDEGGVCYHG